MTVKDSGYHDFPSEDKATETLYKEIFLAFLAVLRSKDLFYYSINPPKNYNGLTPSEKCNMATTTTGLYQRSVRLF